MCFYIVLDSRATSYIGWPLPAFCPDNAMLAEHFPNALQRYNIFRAVPNIEVCSL
jgi:hypothetical protein